MIGRLLAILGIVHHVGEVIVGGVERLHLGGAIRALFARCDAFLVTAQRLQHLGDSARITFADGAAIGAVGSRRGQHGKREKAGVNAMQSAPLG